MADEASEYLAPEQRARIDVDAQLAACGWVVQDCRHAAIAAEIVEELEATLEEFRALAESLEGVGVEVESESPP